ncbi:MAG TPA: hypothetical protein VF218_07580 [Acidothermaceae bacterium]
MSGELTDQLAYSIAEQLQAQPEGPAPADRAEHERRQMTRIANLARPKGPLR